MNQSEAVETTVQGLHPMHAVYLIGLILMAVWALRTRWGTQSLKNTQPRRNVMPPVAPLGMFLLWFIGTSSAATIANFVFAGAPEERLALYRNSAYLLAAVLISTAILIFAAVYFARGFRGFGLSLWTLHRDGPLAFIYLLAIWPLLTASVLITPEVVKLFKGADYQIPQHEQLKLLSEHPVLALQISVFLVGAIAAPILEELLFRGLFQTMLRKYLRSPWPAIALTSLFFASVHPDVSHWPTLFILSLCLGYAYEKSNSILQPILIHALFNGISVVSVLLET